MRKKLAIFIIIFIISPFLVLAIKTLYDKFLNDELIANQLANEALIKFNSLSKQNRLNDSLAVDSCLALLENAISLNDTNMYFYLGKTLIHDSQGQYDESIKAINKIHEFKKYYSFGYSIQGFYYELLGDATNAKECYNNAYDCFIFLYDVKGYTYQVALSKIFYYLFRDYKEPLEQELLFFYNSYRKAPQFSYLNSFIESFDKKTLISRNINGESFIILLLNIQYNKVL